jgi:ribosomal protein S1
MTTITNTPAFAVDAVLFKEEDIIEGVIVAIEKSALYVDLGVA